MYNFRCGSLVFTCFPMHNNLHCRRSATDDFAGAFVEWKVSQKTSERAAIAMFFTCNFRSLLMYETENVSAAIFAQSKA